MTLRELLLGCLVLISGHEVLGARILAIMPLPSPSHHIWNRALTLELAKRGHQVLVVSPDVEKQPVPNYTEIKIEGAYERILEAGYNYEEKSSLSYIENVYFCFQWGQDACNYAMGTKAAQKLKEMSGREKFDLVIIDTTIQECFLSFVPLFDNPPVIIISAYMSPPWFNSIVGNPQIPSYINTYILPYTDHMSFTQRMRNFLFHTYTTLHRTYLHLPAMDNISLKHFGPSVPLPSELQKNISLVMVNTHFSLDFPRPIVPAMIQVGGMQVTPPKPLPQDLKKFLDGAEHGAIFFCLGSNVRSDKMRPEKVQAFLEAFSELPQRVLWKWESDSLPGQLSNVKVGKWMPQNDILAHPNVHLFISHSGMLSTQEALYHGVPVVGMPFLGDQHVNIVKLETRGLGRLLEYETLSKQSVLQTVREVLDNPSYRNNMKKISTYFRDQPETPLERAVYWSEYIIRHKGGAHLRARSADMPLYQYILLDVLAVLALGAVVVLVLLSVVLRTVYRLVVPVKKHKQH